MQVVVLMNQLPVFFIFSYLKILNSVFLIVFHSEKTIFAWKKFS